jgi:hypothetical protein
MLNRILQAICWHYLLQREYDISEIFNGESTFHEQVL